MKNITNFQTKADKWLVLQQKTLKKSTYSCYHRIITKRIVPHFKSYNIDDIFNDEIFKFVSSLEECGYSYKYICDILSVLKIFLEDNDKHIDFRFVKKKIMHLQAKRHPKTLSAYQQKKFIDILISENDNRAIGCLVSLYTGMRIGEICALKCKNIDIDSKTITINNTMQRIQKNDENRRTEVIIDSPKSVSSNRIIPIPNCIFGLICSILGKPEDFFLTGDSNRYVEPRSMQNYISKLYARLDICGLSFHNLRHTFATKCLEINFDLKSLSEILGHSSVTTTLNLYVHPSFQTKQKNMNKLTF